MIRENPLFQRIETELLDSGQITDSTCADFEKLPSDIRLQVIDIMKFLGCKDINDSASSAPISMSDNERLFYIRLMLLRMSAHTEAPVWSSWVVQQFWQVITSLHEGNPSDFVIAYFKILAEFQVTLTQTVTHFIRDMVVEGIRLYKDKYDHANFQYFSQNTPSIITQSQAYLCVFGIPPQFLTPTWYPTILKSLTHTNYLSLVLNEISDELKDDKNKILINEWLQNEESISIREILRKALE